MTSRAVLHGHLLAILGHDLSFDAVLGQAETLPLGIFFHLEGMRSLDEILNRDNASDALDKIERFANKVEITLAVLGHLRLLGKEMHGFAKSGGDGFAVLDMLAKRFAKAQDRVELAAILPVVGSYVHAQKRRVVLLLQGKLFKNPYSQAELNKIVPFGFSLQRQTMVFFCHQNSIILLC